MTCDPDFFEYDDDFFGGGALPTTATAGCDWGITDTSSAGAPTYVYVDGSKHGEVTLTLASTAEAENVCLSHLDKLNFDIDSINLVMMIVKQGQATIDSATSIAFGMTGDRNDAIDSIAQHALFRLIGSNAIVCETDDGTTDKDDIATGATLADSYKVFTIDMSDKSDVKFYIRGVGRVAAGTTFDMSAYTGSLQPFLQIQKTSDANTDAVTIDRFYINGRRVF